MLLGGPGEVKIFLLRTTIGRPLGSESFIGQFDKSTGQILHACPIGRMREEAIGMIDGKTEDRYYVAMGAVHLAYLYSLFRCSRA